MHLYSVFVVKLLGVYLHVLTVQSETKLTSRVGLTIAVSFTAASLEGVSQLQAAAESLK